MADIITPKLNLTKPEVGGSTDSWGTKLNADLDAVDALFDTGPFLKIANGGTGAGTAANARTNLGLGTLSQQAADAVNIDGGAIDGTPIGAATPSTVKGTTVEATTAVKFPDGTLQTTAAGAGIAYEAKSATFTAVPGHAYCLTGNNVMVVLPVAPSDNAAVIITNGAAVSGCSVGRSSRLIMGLAEDMALDQPNFAIKLVFFAALNDWRIAL